MAVVDWQTILAELYKLTDLVYFKEQFRLLKQKRLSIGWVIEFVRLVKELVTRAEWIALEVEGVGGEDKRKAVQAFLERVVNLPFPLSLFEGTIFKLLIDFIVQWLNLDSGHAWVQKYPEYKKS